MAYLTIDEYKSLGFEEVDNFEKLSAIAEQTIDLFTNYYYKHHSLEDDIPIRKSIVKQALAHQISYLNDSGILTSESKIMATEMRIGRTSISLKNGLKSDGLGIRYNLSLDALNLLKSIGMGYREVLYDR